jgi:hypothetical protein
LQETCQQQQEIYAPISVVYGEVRDLFMKVFRNVGLFIQIPVGFFDWTNARKTPDTTNAQRTRPYKKRGAGFPAPLLVEIDLA